MSEMGEQLNGTNTTWSQHGRHLNVSHFPSVLAWKPWSFVSAFSLVIFLAATVMNSFVLWLFFKF
jgi:hypothetical protein